MSTCGLPIRKVPPDRILLKYSFCKIIEFGPKQANICSIMASKIDPHLHLKYSYSKSAGKNAKHEAAD